VAEADVGWVSLSDLARALGRDKGGVSRRVSRFEAQRLINTRVGTAGQKLIRIDEYKRAVEAGGDAVQEVNGRKAGAARDGEGAPSAVLVLSRAQASKTAAQARLAQLDLAQRLGQLLPIEETRRAATDCSMRLRRTVTTMHIRAEEVADGLARDGSSFARTLLAAMRNDHPGARSFFKALSRDHLEELARMATALDEAEPEVRLEPSPQMAAVRAGRAAETRAEA
jgi:DNA-binding MarR family transcriptional regulator